MKQGLSGNKSLLSEERNTADEREDYVFQLFQKTGLSGKYQKITLIFWCLTCYLCGGITLLVPFLLYQDPYECPDSHPQMTCEEFVCSLPEQQRYQFIPEAMMSTMANKFGDYRCPSQSQMISLAVMIIYSSAIVAYIVLAVFGDYIGRKRLMQLGLFLVTGGLIMAIFSVNLEMGAVGMMISCLGGQWIYTSSLLFISETVCEKKRDQFLVISQTFYGVGHLGNPAFFFLIRDWQLVFVYCYAIPAVIVFILISFFVVDTPICLVTFLTPNKARKALFWVAKVNGKKDFYVSLDQIKEVKQMEKCRLNDSKEGSKFSLIDLFRYPSLRWMTICVVLMQNSILFLFYAPNLMIAQFQLDVFVSGAIIGASSLIAYPFCYFAITRMKRKIMALVSFGVVLSISLILVFIWRPKSDQVQTGAAEQIIIMILFFVISFAITSQYIFFQVYVLELYPTQIRVIGCSFAQIIGGIAISCADFIVTGCEDNDFSVMIVFCIFATVSIILTFFLPQTFNKIPLDFIKELAPHGSHITHSKRQSQAHTKGDLQD